MHVLTLDALLRKWSEKSPEGVALLLPGREGLSYAALYAHVNAIRRALHSHGITRSDGIALAMPNGPEMATALLAAACTGVCAPLNPAYQRAEMDFFLQDLSPRLLLVPEGEDSSARAAAADQGIAVVDVRMVEEYPAGRFALMDGDSFAAQPCDPPGVAMPSDVALVLHTSGTTARPKRVPLSHQNLCVSAGHVANSLELGPTDRCLNVMPLFHIHGIVAALLASLCAGGCVICTPGFSAEAFADTLRDQTPTWYTAVPTVHQSVLDAMRARQDARNAGLRFIRSSSSALPPQIMAELEATFACPVIEAYGMTEAAHQMTSNPLPPRPRKPGSVGLPAGPDVGVMNTTGDLLPPGETGEIVIRGPNVMQGYADNADANKAAFTNGWFRTGDEGFFDEHGYLVLSGRIKEMINRGGEKIAPREIDEALLEHPDIRQATAFSVPHATLGEDLAAAVVLRPGADINERDIRTFAFDRLADFKVPSKIVIVDEIPRGATGKLQRVGLAGKLADVLQQTHAEPRHELDAAVLSVWTEVLGAETIGIDDNFFALGGDSLRGTKVMTRLQAMLAVALPVTAIFLHPSVRELSDWLRDVLSAQRTPGEQA